MLKICIAKGTFHYLLKITFQFLYTQHKAAITVGVIIVILEIKSFISIISELISLSLP